MQYALMFNVLKDGEIEPINWSKEVFKPDRSVILLEEYTPAVWLWHGIKQSLVDRRIASRQAEALKGYGYKTNDTIIGRRTRIIKEIDQRKVGKDPDTDKINQEFEYILNKEITFIDKVIVSFQLDESEFNKIELKLKPNQNTKYVEESKSTSESSTKEFLNNREKLAEKRPQVKTGTSKTKQISKPFKPIKKQEYSFESQVKEIKLSDTAELMNNILKRVERLESKFDIFIKEFREFKNSINEK